jgi:hypothetical protein
MDGRPAAPSEVSGASCGWFLFNHSAWVPESWVLRGIFNGDIALDGDDPEVLDAAQYFIWMFDALELWFKWHKHKRRDGGKPRLEVV